MQNTIFLSIEIVLSINTPTHHLAKRLATSLSPFTISSKKKKNLIKQIKNLEILNGYKMVSFNVNSLFKSTALEESNRNNFQKDMQLEGDQYTNLNFI